MHTYRELVIGGVLVAPFVLYAAVALAIFVLMNPLLHVIGFSRLFSYPPIAALSLYFTILGLIVCLL